MAKKPFYSLEEVCEKLSKSEDEIKSLVRDGELREFRDAGKVFFKAEDIDKLAPVPAESPVEDSGEILLESAADLDTLDPLEDTGGDTGDLPSLVESSGGTSIIGLEPLEDEEEEEKKEDTVITASGIGVFDDDELEIDADPMAKTQITTGATEDDQISLEGAGSGSGLLDLAREADDTALGADLLDEIYPGEEEAVESVVEEPEPEAVEEAEEEKVEEEDALAEVDVGEAVAPVAVATGDPFEGLFSGLLVGGVILMAVASTVLAGLLQGFLPDYGRLLSDGTNFYFFLGGSAAVTIIALVAGLFLGKAFAGRRR
ncbi:MAG: helix-turn-helix domain-containing protein [Phycisphaerae bacterium]|nr:helix-turn-helix domain-containing protein [Phycisphaerae bacterium]